MNLKKINQKTILISLIVILLAIILILIVAYTPLGNSLTEKIVCKQQPYETLIVGGENDGNMDVQLSDVCIKLKRWQKPNYNENWLEYPQEMIVSVD